MIWLLLVVLTVVGGIAAIGIAASERKKLPAGGGAKLLAAGATAPGVERTLRELREGDIVTVDGRDFVCEGIIAYDEDGHRWIGGRIVDGSDVRWLVIGLERAGLGATRLMAVDDAQAMAGYPPEALVIGEVRYTLDKRGTATCELRGDVGAIGQSKQERKPGFAERCRWWLYSAPGDDTLIVEQWGADYRVLRGKKVADGTIELMQAS